MYGSSASDGYGSGGSSNAMRGLLFQYSFDYTKPVQAASMSSALEPSHALLVISVRGFNAEHSLYPAAVSPDAGVHCGSHSHAGSGDRRHYRDFHDDP